MNSFNGNKHTNFGGEKKIQLRKLCGVSILENRRENLKLNVVRLVVILVCSNIKLSNNAFPSLNVRAKQADDSIANICHSPNIKTRIDRG